MHDRPTASATSVSRRMSKQPTKDTRPELELRRRLHAAGLRYRVDCQPIPDTRRRADIIFTRQKIAVFVDGCFWHSCPKHATFPNANAEWWATKLEQNRLRDTETNRLLTDAGWTVVRVWEHDDPEHAAIVIHQLIRGCH
jgi:DNA mismatch endonuclease, patch repair protein